MLKKVFIDNTENIVVAMSNMPQYTMHKLLSPLLLFFVHPETRKKNYGRLYGTI